jgi:hypothetical protein
MEQSKIDMFLLNKGDLFPAESLAVIRERLALLDNNRWGLLSALSFKNPTMALLISVGASILGAGRFYLGQTFLGFAKLALILLYYITYLYFLIEEEFGISTVICIITLIASIIWWFIDLFLIMKTARNINYNKLLTIII